MLNYLDDTAAALLDDIQLALGASAAEVFSTDVNYCYERAAEAEEAGDVAGESFWSETQLAKVIREAQMMLCESDVVAVAPAASCDGQPALFAVA